MKSNNRTPSGYAFGDYMVLVPEALANTPPSEAPACIDVQQAPADGSNEAVSIASDVRKRSRKQPTLQVYSDKDIQEMESSMQSLSRNSDRRKNYEAMIALLRKSAPLGVRRLIKVPRHFGKGLDELEEQAFISDRTPHP